MAASAILKNRKIAIFRPRFNRFQLNLAWRRTSIHLSCPTVKKFKILKIQHSGGRHFKKIEKSPYFGRGLTDFDAIWHSYTVSPPWTFQPLKFQKFKNPRWRCPPSWKIEKWRNLSNGLMDSCEIWHGDAVWPSRLLSVPTVKISKI